MEGRDRTGKRQIRRVYDYNVKSNSKITRAIQVFSEGKAPVDVVIAFDIPADEVRATYREFWELKRMHKLVEVYDQVKYSLRSYLELHKIVNDLVMGEQEIINVLKLANNNDLPYLQDKVEYLRNQINNGT